MAIRNVKSATKSVPAKKTAAGVTKKLAAQAAPKPRTRSPRTSHHRIIEMLDELRTDGEALAARVDQLRQRFS